MSTIDFPMWLAGVSAQVEDKLTAAVRQMPAPPPLRAAVGHALLGSGKRLRPALLIATAVDQQTDSVPVAAWAAASALECIHCYSLVHDDLPCMDDDDLRRGKPACHKIYGDAMAVLAGDCLQALAFSLLADGNLPNAAVKILATAAGGGGLCGGQVLDLCAAADDEDSLCQMHKMKTGALFECAVHLGMLCRDVDDKRLRTFAACFGLLFQIANDIKDEAQDVQAGKRTFVTVLGLATARQRAEESRRSALRALAGDYPILAALTQAVVV